MSIEKVLEHESAISRLATLDLEVSPLTEVVSRSYQARISCSANHPPVVRGIWAWGEAVCALREYTLPRGWRRSDAKNYSLVINDERGIAIAVSMGDEATGVATASPTTSSQKGISTLLAVVANQAQLSLFEETETVVATPSDVPTGEIVTWILLIHRAPHEVRCELSLPSSINFDGRIDRWHERIILPAIPLGGDQIEMPVPAPPDTPDIVVDVQRKA